MRRGVLRLAVGIVSAGVLLAALLSPVVLGGGLVAGRMAATAERISPASLAGETPLVTTVTDRNGTPIATIFDQYRLPLANDQVPDTLKAAIVSIEDRHFYTEHGVDPAAMVRALLNNLGGGPTEGGSTITQQLVKNYLIDVVHRHDPAAQAADRADTITRKVREARSAVELDRTVGKDDILTDYLDVVEFTGRVYGAAAAAHAYFGVPVEKLTVPQAALLAGMVNNPALFDPYAHPAAAVTRRNQVLDAMAATKSISAAAAAAAKKTPLGVLPDGPDVPASTCAGAAPDAGFLCRYALSYLASAGLSADELATGGYTVRTTLDPAVSAAARAAVEHNVPTTQDGVANTMAVIAPGSDRHEVLAMVANRDLGTDAAAGQTSGNIVADVSDPFGAGSVFKIFTAAAALASGDAGLDTPLPNPSSGCFALSGGSCHTVHNDGRYPDPITLADGLATSPNTAFVGLETRVGMPAVLDMANRLGLRETLERNDAGGTPDPASDDPRRDRPQSEYFLDKPSFTLGDSPVSPLELANVSATVMSGGTWCPPDPVLSVTDRFGHDVPVPGAQDCARVVPAGLAHTLMAGLAKDTVDGTSAAAARAAGWTRPGIGKTGTTQTSESVAFVGGADGYAVSSLVFADGAAPGELCPGPPVHLGDCGDGAFGGTVAAPPYFAAMSAILAGHADQPVPAPDPRYSG